MPERSTWTMARAMTPVSYNSMTVIESGDRRETQHGSQRPSSRGKKKITVNREGSFLEVLPSEESEKTLVSASTSDSTKKSGHPEDHRPDSSHRRTPTPSKQISLKAARRKEPDDTPWDWTDGEQKPLPSSRSSSKSLPKSTVKKVDEATTLTGSEPHCTKSQELTQESSTTLAKLEDSDEFDTDLEDGEDETESSEEEERKAPNELLMEFLSCVMQGDYENAQKLCKMVLLYEPENEDALNFQSAIEEKIKLDEELAALSSDSDDEDDDDEEEEDDDFDEEDSDGSDSDSDESDQDSDHDSDDDDDDDNDDDDQKQKKPFLGKEKKYLFSVQEENELS